MAKLFVVLSMLVGFSAQATSIVCNNGTIDQVGDSLYQITVNEKGIQFSPYEAGYFVAAADVQVSGETLTISNLDLVKSVEGTEENITLNAVLIFKDKFTKLTAVVSENNEPQQVYQLNCTVN